MKRRITQQEAYQFLFHKRQNETITLPGADLHDLNLEVRMVSSIPNEDLRKSDLSHADLADADLCKADMKHVDLSHANLTGANVML